MIALGTWSAIVSRTMLKYEEIRRRMSSVSRASRSVSSGSWMEVGGYRCGKGRLVLVVGFSTLER